jgi:uncharacterized protein
MNGPPRARLAGDPLWLLLVLFFAVWTVRALALAALDRRLEPVWLRRLYLETIRASLWGLPALIYVWYAAHSRAGEFLRLTTPVNVGGLVIGEAGIVLYLSGVLAFATKWEGRQLLTSRMIDPSHWGLAIASLAPACFAEEVLFRGVFLREFAERLGFGRANLLTSALFAAIHWPGWYASRGFDLRVVADSVGVFGVSLFAGFLWRGTQSIWPAVVFHLANNVVVGFLK